MQNCSLRGPTNLGDSAPGYGIQHLSVLKKVDSLKDMASDLTAKEATGLKQHDSINRDVEGLKVDESRVEG